MRTMIAASIMTLFLLVASAYSNVMPLRDVGGSSMFSSGDHKHSIKTKPNKESTILRHHRWQDPLDMDVIPLAAAL
ncbi:hypothetical protein ACA910_013604 [Epithemia clementina (nom. ined.)]